MKRFRYFKEKIIFCLMFILLLQLCLMPVESQAVNGQGKIQVQLNDIGTVREGVVVECYQVGELKDGGEYLLLDEYKQTGVDFSDIKTAEDHRNAAEILEKAVKPSGLSHSDKTALSALKISMTEYILLNRGQRLNMESCRRFSYMFLIPEQTGRLYTM